MALAIGQLVGGRYRLDAALARGGMGAVYRATDTRLNRSVAIKALLAELAGDTTEIARFEREAQAIARITHPGIVQVLDVGREGDTEYLVMEHVQGRTLADVLGNDGKLEPMRAAELMEQALFAIAAAHAAGIVHRDLKPGNVMLVPTGGREMVKILDFGIAQLKMGTTYTRLTATGAILGTPAFMAPEQARGEPCDARTDVYAMGVLLWCMLTGKKPFVGKDIADTVGKVLTEVPMRADRVEPTVPAALGQIAETAMQKAPSARFGSAQAFANALAELRQAPRVSHPPTTSDRGQMATMLTGDGTIVPKDLIGAPRLSAPPAAQLPPQTLATPTPVASTFVVAPAIARSGLSTPQLVLGALAVAAFTGLLTCLAGALFLTRCASAALPGIVTASDACERARRCCDQIATDQECAPIDLYRLQGAAGESACAQAYEGYAAAARGQGRTCE